MPQRRNLLILLPLVAACSGNPAERIPAVEPAAAESPLPVVGGRYRGIFEVDDETLRAVLDLRQDEYRLSARLLTVGGMEALGAGILESGSLVLHLSYETSCPGRLRLEGHPVEGGGIRGSLTAEDCTGTARGSFRMAPAPSASAPDDSLR